MKTKFKLLTLSASLLAAGATLSTQAQAGAYSFSSVVLTNGRITVTGGEASLGVTSSATSTSGTPAPMTRAGDVQFGGPGQAPVNAAPATQGTMVRADEDVGGPGNAYNAFGSAGNTAYSWADSNVVSVQTNGTGIEIRNAAEGWIPGEGNANSGAENSSTSTLTSFDITLGGPATLAFEFMADPFGQVMLASDAAAGSKAEANFDNNLTITAVDVPGIATNTEVFSWTPNGVVDPVSGGTEISDAENLNGTIGTITAGDSITFSPGVGFGLFSVVTNELDAGRYQFTLNTDESQFVIQNQVPEPATLALVGLGMLGMGFTVRRRKQS